MKELIVILGAAASIVALAEWWQRQQVQAAVDRSALMNVSSPGKSWLGGSGAADAAYAADCSCIQAPCDCSAVTGEWEKYGVLKPYF